MSNILTYAERELELAGLLDEDSDYGGELGRAVLRMMEVFAEEEHSGASASMAISIFSRLARFEPLTPLTGEEDEWSETFDGIKQNKRCSRVFMNDEGVAYDILGKIFRYPDGCTYTSRDSRVNITFPYSPKSEIIDVEEVA